MAVGMRTINLPYKEEIDMRMLPSELGGHDILLIIYDQESLLHVQLRHGIADLRN